MQSTTVVNAERCMCSREFFFSRGTSQAQSTIVVNVVRCEAEHRPVEQKTH